LNEETGYVIIVEKCIERIIPALYFTESLGNDL
jgi:hypothetical protein